MKQKYVCRSIFSFFLTKFLSFIYFEINKNRNKNNKTNERHFQQNNLIKKLLFFGIFLNGFTVAANCERLTLFHSRFRDKAVFY